MKNFIVVIVPPKEKLREGYLLCASSFRAKSPRAAENMALLSYDEAYPEENVFDGHTVLVSDEMDPMPNDAPAFGLWDSSYMNGRNWDAETNRPVRNNVDGLNEGLATVEDCQAQRHFEGLSISMQNAIIVKFGKASSTPEDVKAAISLTMDEMDSFDGQLLEALNKYPEISVMYPELKIEAVDYVRKNWAAAKGWPAMKQGLYAWKCHHEKKTDPKKGAERLNAGIVLPSQPTDAEKDRLQLIVMLLVMNISPDVARASDIKNARDLMELKDESFAAWYKSLSVVPGIYQMDGGELYVLLAKEMRPAHLTVDDDAREEVISRVFSLGSVESTDSGAGDAGDDSGACDAGAGDAENLHDKSCDTSGSEWADRKGPFYFFSPDTGKIGRANKIDGLIKAIGAGAHEITKEEHAARKAGTYIEEQKNNEQTVSDGISNDATPEKSDEGKTVLSGDDQEKHDDPTPPEESQKLNVEKVAPGVFSIDGLMGTTGAPETAKTETETPDPLPETGKSETKEPETVTEDAKTVTEEATSAPEEVPQDPVYFAPGSYPDIPNEVYHSANGISSTMIKDSRVSLMYYRERHVTKRIVKENSKVLDMGNLIHTAVLEPEKLDLEYSVEPVIQKGYFVKSSDYKKFIEQFNETVPEAVSVDELKDYISRKNSQMAQPYALGEDVTETLGIYQALPEEFQRIGSGDKITAAKMKACIKEFNATLPPLYKLNGSREALLETIESFDSAFVRDIRNAPAKISASGTKADMAAAIKLVKPDAVFYDELVDEWKRNPENKILVTQEQMNLALNIQKAVLSHKKAGSIVTHPDRVVEESYFGVDDETGLEVRVRPDLLIPFGNLRVGFDLKSISMWGVKENHLKEKIRREIIDRDYHLSAAMYCDVASLDQFFWIFVNKDEHYHWVVVVEATEELLELGRAEYLHSLTKIAHGYDFDEWPAPITEDYSQGISDYDKKRLEYLNSL